MRKNKGFFLAEAVLAVAITILIVLTLQQLLFGLKKADQCQIDNNEVAYAYVQLDRFLHAEPHEKVFTNSLAARSRWAAFTKKHGGKTKRYYIDQHDHLLRLRTEEGGHMPLLLHVKQTHFVTSKRLIKIHVVEEDGRASDLIFKLKGKREDE